MPLRLYFIRHGQTEWSLSGQHSGRANISLTAQGEDEARAVGQRLRDIAFAHVLTSPLQRAQQTCALAALGPMPRIEPNLAEWDNGERSALKRQAIDRWENEGGEIPNVLTPQPAAMSAERSQGKRHFIFDLDGTLAEGKAPLDA